jgi:thiol-disulfide isomerase/thioredoxin
MRTRTLAVFLETIALFVTCACGQIPRHVAQDGDVRVALAPTRFSNEPPLIGLSNLMFDTLRAGRLVVKPEWGTVEVAPLFEGQGYVPVLALRYRQADSVVRIIVDDDADSDFTNNEPLSFRRVGALELADVDVRLRAVASTSTADRLAMQVVLSAPYTYGRISQYLSGTMKLGENSYAVALRPLGRSSPIEGLTSGVQLLIDADRDGQFREAGIMDTLGNLAPSEQFRADRPFAVGSGKLAAVALEQRGQHLLLRYSAARTSPAVGFSAPPLTGSDIEGRPHSLSELRGGVVLLAFWATTCPWSERARPALDSLAARLGSAGFTWVAMARDTSRDVLRAHIATHPMSAIVLAADSSAWVEYNPNIITPLFYLIDREGNTRLVERGANALAVIVRAATKEVMNPQYAPDASVPAAGGAIVKANEKVRSTTESRRAVAGDRADQRSRGDD